MLWRSPERHLFCRWDVILKISSFQSHGSEMESVQFVFANVFYFGVAKWILFAITLIRPYPSSPMVEIRTFNRLTWSTSSKPITSVLDTGVQFPNAFSVPNIHLYRFVHQVLALLWVVAFGVLELGVTLVHLSDRNLGRPPFQTPVVIQTLEVWGLRMHG